MGKPRRRVATRSIEAFSRRSFLKGAAAVSALLTVPPVFAKGAGEISAPPPGTPTGPFVHGVASGDPLVDRVILWTRVTPAGAPRELTVGYVVATDPALSQVVTRGNARTDRNLDFTVKLDVTGLSPNTTYYYQFSSGDGRSPVGRTKTLPAGNVDRLRIGVASCASLAHGYFNAYRHMARRADLDLVLHLGDYIYEFGNGEYGNLRSYEPATEIITLHDYRTRHNQYKTDPDLQELHRQHPMCAIWDDHEVADNAWKNGAANHQPATEGSYSDRVAAAVRAYHEWMPIRPQSADRKRINRSFRLGNLVEVFMLEERLTGRSEPAEPNIVSETPLFVQEGEFTDPDRTMIKSDQQRWLAGLMSQSSARWKVIGQGVMLAPARAAKTPEGDDVYFNPDQWDGYQPARDRLLDDISPIDNTVVLTGDIHSSWAADLSHDPFGGGYDPGSGEGSLGVELVATSVTSPGFNDPDGQVAAALRLLNPHIKYIDLTQNGYMLLDVTHERLSSEWWYVDTVMTRGGTEVFGTALQTLAGSRRLLPGTMSPPPAAAPPLAP